MTRFGVDGALVKTVFSINPVESMIEIVRRTPLDCETAAGRRGDAALGRCGDGVRPQPVP